MQVRDFLEHEWQPIGAIQCKMAENAVALPEIALVRVLRSMQGVIVSDDGRQVRLAPPTT